MSMGQQIKAMRRFRGMTQANLADKLGVEYQTVQAWECGTRNPKFETLQKIAEALETPIGTFLPAMGMGDNLGNRIRITRKRQKITLEEIGQKMGMSGSLVGRYERGEENPKTSTIKRFAEALNVSARWLETGFYEDASISNEEQQLLRYFRIMNQQGQHVALERMEELSQHPKYKKDF